MKKTINICCLLITLSVSAQIETLKDWIFPTKNNFQLLKSKTKPDDFFRINYFKISDNLVGTSLEIGLMNSEPSSKLFEIRNDEISLIKTKDGAFGDMGGEEHDFGENNIYFKLPTNIGTTKWSYADDSGTIYYGLCYWKEGKEKFLVIERQMSGKQQFPEKTVEYYSLGKGLSKIETYNPTTKKLIDRLELKDSSFDKDILNEDFPLNTELNEAEKVPDQALNSNEIESQIPDEDDYNMRVYGRTEEQYQKLFKNLPNQQIKKTKYFDRRTGKYKILNILWYPRQEAINRQKYIDAKANRNGKLFN